MNKKQFFISFCLMFMFGAGVLHSKALETHFKKANELYEKSDFKAALDLYHRIEKQGFYSAELFYNIGNVYYRLDDLSRGLLYFERAYRIAPRDKDIKHNRNFLLKLTGQQENVWFKILSFLNLNELLVLCLVIYCLFFVVLIAGWWYQPAWIIVMRSLFIIIGICVGIWLLASYFTFYHHKTAIVLDNDANVYSGPNDDSTIVFTVPKAKKIVVFDELEIWASIGIPEKGLKGWTQKSGYESI